jgi:glycosyltransferase involved in cell wall biosynthesis
MRRQGVVVKFIVYDLLCVTMPKYFFPGADEHFSKWLNVIAETDGAICISKSVANELTNWLQQKTFDRKKQFSISFTYLGADFKTRFSKDASFNENSKPNFTVDCPAFLMVGTLEPRKGHMQVLDAFEILWKCGVGANLVIVGKKGWMVERLIDRLRHHPELNKRLFWVESMSDDELDMAYASSSCLIAASYGEGFGLPLVEASQHKLPIICRDIPVFREVAGENAYYFVASKPEHLAESLQQWLDLYSKDKNPRSDGIPWITWKQSASQFLRAIGI